MTRDSSDRTAARTVATAFWRRLDAPGHDACRLLALADGWRLEGLATFLDGEHVVALRYAVDCAADWTTRRGTVHGFRGDASIDWTIEHDSASRWTLNGEERTAVRGLRDLDLSFTPATNLLHLRRAQVPVGEAAEIPVAWLELSAGTLAVLPQRYERRAEREYWYEAPTQDFRGVLVLGEDGFAKRYPELWEREPLSS